jgi:hypothetical protein
MTADTPRTTVAGNTFIVPKDWSVSVKGPATILQPPEGDSAVAVVDVKATNAEAALELGWAAYKPDRIWQIEEAAVIPDKVGWSQIKQFTYATSPAEKRWVGAAVMFANDSWTVLIVDLAESAGARRDQIELIIGKLLPKRT